MAPKLKYFPFLEGKMQHVHPVEVDMSIKFVHHVRVAVGERPR